MTTFLSKLILWLALMGCGALEERPLIHCEFLCKHDILIHHCWSGSTTPFKQPNQRWEYIKTGCDQDKMKNIH